MSTSFVLALWFNARFFTIQIDFKEMQYITVTLCIGNLKGLIMRLLCDIF